jgi:hypothetical protein
MASDLAIAKHEHARCKHSRQVALRRLSALEHEYRYLREKGAQRRESLLRRFVLCFYHGVSFESLWTVSAQ